MALSSQLYEQEQARISARFEEAVRLAEEAFLAEFARLVAHLGERLTGTNDDGTAKVFRDSAIGNLVEFFQRFRRLNVRSNARLDALVAEAERIVRGVGPQELREGGSLRQRVATELSQVQAWLDDLLVDRPRRRILRQASAGGGVMLLVVHPNGCVSCVYDEMIDLAALGRPAITRASHVEPDANGRWIADLRPCGGPVLGPFERRSIALDAERTWLEAHWLGAPSRTS